MTVSPTVSRGRHLPRRHREPSVGMLVPLHMLHNDDILYTQEVAAYTGYAVSTLETWRRRNTDRGPKWNWDGRKGYGRRGHYRVADLRRWMLEHGMKVT